MSDRSAQDSRERILADLSSSEDEVRRLAMEQIDGLPLDEALSHLVEGLGDSCWRVRKVAVERLVNIPRPAGVVDALIGALADGENTGRRNSASEALIAIGKQATDALLAALSCRDTDVRKLVVDVLGAIADANSTDALIETLDDSDVNVRAAAAEALSALGGDDACDSLIDLALDASQDRLVRLSALRALEHFGDGPNVEQLEPLMDDAVLRSAAFALLGRTGDEAALPHLLKGLAISSWSVRSAAMVALVRILSSLDGRRLDSTLELIRDCARSIEDLVPASIDRLTDADLGDRLVLIQFLGVIRDGRCVLPILASVRDEAVADVARATLEAMGPAAISVLEEAWPRLEVGLRREVCVLAGKIGGQRVCSLLRQALDDDDMEMRIAAAASAGRCGNVELLSPLVRRLERLSLMHGGSEAREELDVVVEALAAMALAIGPDGRDQSEPVIAAVQSASGASGEAMRFAMASLLRAIARPSDADSVSNLLKDPSARVRRAAVEALRRLGSEAGAESLRLALADESPLVRIAAATVLGESTLEEAEEDLRRLVHDEDTRVSAAAIRSIGSHCKRNSISADRALALLDESLLVGGMVSLAAIRALDEIGSERAAEVASHALANSETEIVQAAVGCISRHGGDLSLLKLIPLIVHDAWPVRAEAVQALAQRGVREAAVSMMRLLESERDEFVRDAIVRALERLED